MDGSFWHGRRIACAPKEDKNQHASRVGRTATSSGRESTPTPQLFIGNIPYETTDTELNAIFKSLNGIRDVRIAVDRTTGWPRGFAHADFATTEDATAAIEALGEVRLGERSLRIDYASGFQKGGREGGREGGRRSEEGGRNYRRNDSRNDSRNNQDWE